MRSYKPEELFDHDGSLIPELKALTPQGHRRMSANPHANGGLIRKDLRMPDFRAYAAEIPKPGQLRLGNTRPLGELLRDMPIDCRNYAREQGIDMPPIREWTWPY